MEDIDFIEDIDVTIKVIILGNGSVGKSSLAVRYAKNVFVEEYKKTIGVDYLQKKKYMKSIEREVQFNIWDTAGQEYFDAITKKYYRGAQIALFVFSVTDRDSFTSIKSWKDKVVDICGEDIPMFLIMNKIDVASSDRKVTEEEAISLASNINMMLFQVSVKGNVKIDDIFENAAKEYFNKGLNKKSTDHIQDVADVNKDPKKKNEDIREVVSEKNKSNAGFTISNRQSTNADKKKKGSGCC